MAEMDGREIKVTREEAQESIPPATEQAGAFRDMKQADVDSLASSQFKDPQQADVDSFVSSHLWPKTRQLYNGQDMDPNEARKHLTVVAEFEANSASFMQVKGFLTKIQEEHPNPEIVNIASNLSNQLAEIRSNTIEAELPTGDQNYISPPIFLNPQTWEKYGLTEDHMHTLIQVGKNQNPDTYSVMQAFEALNSASSASLLAGGADLSPDLHVYFERIKCGHSDVFVREAASKFREYRIANAHKGLELPDNLL